MSASAGAENGGGWFFLDAHRQHRGPYDEAGLEGLAKQGYLAGQMVVWRKGMTGWKKLEDVEELSHIQGAIDREAIRARQAEAAAATAQKAQAAGTDNAMAAFQAEVGALQAKQAADGAVASYSLEDMIFDASAGDDGKRKGGPKVDLLAQTEAHERAQAAADGNGADPRPAKKHKRTAVGAEGGAKQRRSTAVYIEGLPADATAEEVAREFGKCGIILKGEDLQPRVKLYRDKASGGLKGDALVVYLRRESVDLAVKILNGAQLRPGEPPIRVSEATFTDRRDGGGGGGEAENGAGRGAQEKKKGPRKGEKNVVRQQLERMLGWGGEDRLHRDSEVVVVLRNAFDPHAGTMARGSPEQQQLERDMRQGCEEHGRVEKLRIYDRHPDGLVTVRFLDPDHAAACVAAMDGRFYAGRKLAASLWDGVDAFAEVVAPRAGGLDEEEERRLERFAQELEQSGDEG
ncbi:unnamed protein product [Pedinophyceae sp. YPF-701]|nr:unnamed protein product [Pedinophyceae sp. YPF-701]